MAGTITCAGTTLTEPPRASSVGVAYVPQIDGIGLHELNVMSVAVTRRRIRFKSDSVRMIIPAYLPADLVFIVAPIPGFHHLSIFCQVTVVLDAIST